LAMVPEPESAVPALRSFCKTPANFCLLFEQGCHKPII
jgi:hypothetical protein